MGCFTWPEIEYREVELEAPAECCDICGGTLWISQWRRRKLQTFNGLIVLIAKDKRCHNQNCPGQAAIHRHPGEITIAVPNDSLALEVLLQIGQWRLDDNLSFAAIHRKLKTRGITIAERNVSEAFKRLLALLHGIDGESPETLDRLRRDGIILLVDGVQFDETSTVLYVAMDAASRTVLFAERHDARSADALESLLQRVKALGVPVRGVVSDKETGLVPAIRRVFPDAPHQYCQLHFVNRCAAPLKTPLAELSAEVEAVGQQVRAMRRELAAAPPPIDDDERDERELVEGLLHAAHGATKVAGRAPFDPPALKRHERLRKVSDVASTAASLRARKKGASAAGRGSDGSRGS